MPEAAVSLAKLDLRNDAHRRHLCGALNVAGHPYLTSTTPAAVESAIESLVRLLPRQISLTLLPVFGGLVEVQISTTLRTSISLEMGLQLGRQLADLEHCDGFVTVQRSLNGLQFHNTLFEVAVAHYCRERYPALRFSPRYVIKSKDKYPDFEFDSPHGIVVAECKSAETLSTEGGRTFSRICQTLSAALIKTDPPDDGFYVAVVVEGPIKGNLHRLASEMASWADAERRAERLSTATFGALRAYITRKGERPAVQGPAVWFGTAGASTAGVPVNLVAATDVAVATSLQRLALHRNIGSLINEAKDQLPQHLLGAVFVNVVDRGSAEAAAQRRLNTPSYKHVVTVGIWTRGQLASYSYRDDREALVETLFGPFP